MTGGRSFHLSLDGERWLPKEEGGAGNNEQPVYLVFIQSFVTH